MMKLNKFYLFYVHFAKCNSFYSYPCPSDKLAVYRVSQPSEEYTAFPLMSMSQKYMLLPRQNYCVAFPLLHGVQSLC